LCAYGYWVGLGKSRKRKEPRGKNQEKADVDFFLHLGNYFTS
jgi:hypothetical protein